MYANGLGVSQDLDKARKYLREAAERGSAMGQNGLGELYLEGKGVPQDDREALRWFKRAHEQGNAQAQFHLGQLYQHGLPSGVVTSRASTALQYYSLAASQSHTRALYELGQYSNTFSYTRILSTPNRQFNS